jgi:hypothetical protein
MISPLFINYYQNYLIKLLSGLKSARAASLESESNQTVPRHITTAAIFHPVALETIDDLALEVLLFLLLLLLSTSIISKITNYTDKFVMIYSRENCVASL